jgi:hypothetical protein
MLSDVVSTLPSVVGIPFSRRATVPMKALVTRSAARNGMDVERLTDRLERLTRERQNLRARRDSVEELERNRLEIIRAQWDLSRALIDRYLRLQHAG